MAVKNTTQYPPRPIREVAARGFVRFDSSTIGPSEMPALKLPARNIADRGIVRLGSCGITSVR